MFWAYQCNVFWIYPSYRFWLFQVMVHDHVGAPRRDMMSNMLARTAILLPLAWVVVRVTATVGA